MSWKTVALDSDLYTYDYFLTDYVCRLCWCQNGVKEITAKMSENVDTTVTIAELIYECIGVDLSTNTRPTKICSSCWSEVENFSEFRNFCHTTQEKLYDILQNASHITDQIDIIDDDEKSNKSFDYPSETFSNLELESMNTIFEDLNKESIELKRKKPNKKKQKPDTYCSQCKTDFDSISNLSQHNKEIHRIENGLYKCFGCDRAFKQRKRCVRHETENCKVLKDGYKCGICGKFSQKRTNFEIHLRAHRENVDLPDETYKCKKCAKEFISMELLTEHMTMHEKEKKNWVCDMKSKPLGKDEVMLLLDLISKYKVLTSKATNATNNKLKEDAWKSIAQEFCALAGDLRRPEQLRLKWENLKKAARKRNASIRQNNLKTGGGKSFIPPDEALDRVASILGPTCSGFTVDFGGDRENLTPHTPEAVVEVIDFQPLPELPELTTDRPDVVLVMGGESGHGEYGGGRNKAITPKTFTFNTPKNSCKRRKLSEEIQRAQKEKELAMAAYFKAKTEKVCLENIKLKLEIEQLMHTVNKEPV